MSFELCPPALFYLVISSITLILFIIQNVGNTSVWCLGDYQCDVNNNTFVLFVQFLYIILTTTVLQLICAYVTPIISWGLVLIIILSFFIFTGSIFLLQKVSPVF